MLHVPIQHCYVALIYCSKTNKRASDSPFPLLPRCHELVSKQERANDLPSGTANANKCRAIVLQNDVGECMSQSPGLCWTRNVHSTEWCTVDGTIFLRHSYYLLLSKHELTIFRRRTMVERLLLEKVGAVRHVFSFFGARAPQEIPSLCSCRQHSAHDRSISLRAKKKHGKCTPGLLGRNNVCLFSERTAQLEHHNPCRGHARLFSCGVMRNGRYDNMPVCDCGVRARNISGGGADDMTTSHGVFIDRSWGRILVGENRVQMVCAIGGVLDGTARHGTSHPCANTTINKFTPSSGRVFDP